MSREELSAALAKMNADVAAAGGKMTVGTPRALERATLTGLASRASQANSRDHKACSNDLLLVRALMRARLRCLCSGLTIYPPYPVWPSVGTMKPWTYQNAGDWAWFGGRVVQALVKAGLLSEVTKGSWPFWTGKGKIC